MPRSEKEGIPTFLLQGQPNPTDPAEPTDPTAWTKDEQIRVEYKKRQDAVFPAGAYYASIRPLEYDAPININGTDYYLGEEFNGEMRADAAEQTVDLLDAIDIVANENLYIIVIAYPSAFGQTETQLNNIYQEN